ncbi:hypothetical protein B0H14DRAFT_2632852 [Mycena olivaceomarginata]|nr:hypothetical protein B0H14DRAFT_2632852 [Mycena olivaceomarginata]
MLNILPRTILYSLFPRGLSQSELNQHKVVVDDPDDPVDGASIIWYESEFDAGLFRYVLESFGLRCRLVAGYHAVERPSGLLQAELLIIREKLFCPPEAREARKLAFTEGEVWKVPPEPADNTAKSGKIFFPPFTPSVRSTDSVVVESLKFHRKFETGDEWGFRALQPSSTRLSSITVVAFDPECATCEILALRE